ncbi:hypothetical protein RhiirA5_386627, partial [Rhizophagus irregularis]
HDYNDCVSFPRADLLNLVFTHYSSADAKLSDEAKSLFVTDIPLFLNETQVRQAFSRYGTVIKCKLTPKKHYYNGHIQFSSADVIAQFNDIWAIICLGNSLRVCPASFLKSQRDSRREHVTILAGILKNIKEADLLEIATQVNAKALNVPLSINSYKPKPYVYLNFSLFDTLEAAKELSVAFRGKGLTWHPPNEAHTLCHVCGRSGCSPSVCNPRLAHKVDDHLNKLYSRFNAGPRRGHQDSRQSHYTIPIYNTTPLPAFVKFLRSQKALVSAYLFTQFHQHRVDSIEYYTALRDEHFSTSPSSFISSALSVEHHSIVFDRVLVVIDSKPTLLTEPSDIKQAAIKHFQSVVAAPLVQYSSIDEFPSRWQRAYSPIS